MLTIPLKTSHRLQPFDVSMFGLFKRNYNKVMDNWMITYPSRTLTIYKVPALAKEAQLCALVPRNILFGFKNTGTWPYNPDIFAEEDFAAATITDRRPSDIQIPLINDLPVDSARSSACTSQSVLIGGGPSSHTMQARSLVDDATSSGAKKQLHQSIFPLHRQLYMSFQVMYVAFRKHNLVNPRVLQEKERHKF